MADAFLGLFYALIAWIATDAGKSRPCQAYLAKSHRENLAPGIGAVFSLHNAIRRKLRD
jgi:hypothetical protein